MLKLLFEEHISPEIAEGLLVRQKDMVVHCLADWESGRFLGVADDAILEEAAAQRLTLVTYDRKTIPPLLKRWAEAGREHGGVIFVDQETIPSSDFGGLVWGMQKLFQESAKWDWQNRVSFLRR
jgi:hypothetical protein